MTPAAPMSQNNSIDQLPLARLYAEEESFIFPLREYLESHGCRVIINTVPDIQETYFIIAGSSNFVKGIFATQKTSALRVLGIVITSIVSEAQMLLDDSRKIVVIDPRYLTEFDVDEIFSFFFSGSELLLNITRNIHEPPAVIEPASRDADPQPVSDTRLPEHDEAHVTSSKNIVHQSDDLLSDKDTERISHIMSDIFDDKRSKKKIHTTQKIFTQLSKFFSSAFLYTVFFLGIILFPISTYFAGLSATTYFLLRTTSFIGKTDNDRARSSLDSSRYWLNQTTFIFSLIKLPMSFLGLGTQIRGQEKTLSLVSDIALGIEESLDVVEQGRQFIKSSFPSSIREDEKLPASSLESLRISIVAAHNNLGLAEAELFTLIRDKIFPFSISFLHDPFSTMLVKLQSARRILSYGEQLLTVYPKIAGFKNTQSYLVLLQNSNELRPTGGFIGSVGMATFENGTVSDFSIEDVYALDGQLKGHVPPPKPIAELLGSEHWYLRDSNWDPDFAISGQRAAWFYEKETGKHVDGVIAINVPIIESILKAIGPIQLPDYSDRITQDNFFGKSLYYTQNNFFPGSTQKRDFLGTLARSVMTKIITDRDIDGMALVNALMRGVEHRDILFQFQNPEVQSMIEHFKWGGRVFDNTLCSGIDANRCFSDEMLISEANLSVSKVNYYVTHDARREITITPQGEVNERVFYTIGNTVNTAPNPNEKGVGGPYLTYIRFIIPKDGIVNTVMLDGIAIPTRSTTQKNLPDIPYIENSDGTPTTRSIGIALQVPPGERKEIQISYARSQRLLFGKGGGYLDLLWYKHPGISSLPLQTIIRYPIYWKAIDASVSSDEKYGTFIAKEGEFEYNTNIERDTNYRIKFIQ